MRTGSTNQQQQRRSQTRQQPEMCGWHTLIIVEDRRNTYNQTFPSDRSIASCQIPECTGEEGERDCETPFDNSQADIGPQAADCEHQGEEGHGEEVESE